MTQSPTAGEATQRVQVGNFPVGTTEAQLRALFLPHGAVGSYERPVDAHTERPGGFVYFVMSAADAMAAIKALNGRPMGDRKITVNLARPLADWAPGAGRRPISQTPRRIVTPQTSRADASRPREA